MRGLLCASAAIGLLVGCSSAKTPTIEADGFVVRVQYDSTMAVEAFAVTGVSADGAEVWPRTEREAPLFLDPPGPREARLTFERPAPQMLGVLVDGLDALGGAVVGSGHANLEVDATLSEVVVRLGAPVRCGDGRLAAREACDDGNAAPEDGCSAACMVEPGYTCVGTPSRCGRCGDGEIGPGEGCDDGNNADGDGCSAICEPEAPEAAYLVEVEALAPSRYEGPEWTEVEGAQLTLPAAAPGERWLVFASGAVGSTSEAEVAAQVGLLVDGELVDDFGHQTLGGEANEAGFVTFHLVEDSPAPDVRLVAAAEEGVTTVRDVRLVGLRVPSRVELRSALDLEGQQMEGIDSSLLSLEIRGTPGKYLVLAKANLTESPGADTARIWLEGPDGRVPFDDRGASFSSPRDAKVPFFLARPVELADADARFELRGTSSGAGSVDGWWSPTYPYRRRVTVTAGQAALPEGLAVPVRFDHQALVAEGKSLPDGRDIRAVVGQGLGAREVTRAVDAEAGWGQAQTTVWVRLPSAVAPGETFADLWLYFGASPLDTPPSAPEDVFDFYDGFARRELGAPWTVVQGSPQMLGAALQLSQGASVIATVDPNAVPAAPLLEARLAFDPAPSAGQAILLSTTERTSEGLAGNGFVVREGQFYANSGAGAQAIDPGPATDSHVFGIALPDAQTVAFYVDDQEVARVAPGIATTPNPAIGLQNGTDVAAIYDWVRVRGYVEDPPSVTVEATTGVAGLRPSLFDGLRLLALRVDGFEGFFATVHDERVRTTESATVTLTRLDVPEADRPREHLVILSSRVAGDSGERSRVGLCLADGQALLQTRHRINRDASDPTGYHHVAGVVDARTTADPVRYETAIRSPEGLGVEGAASSAAVIRF